MSQKRIIKSIFIAFIAIITLLIPYIFVFKNQIISTNTEDWGSFGSYLSGIISVINLIVFIYITFWLTKLDDDRSNNEIKNQRIITLTQFRQSELEKLNVELSKPIENNGTEEVNIIISRYTYASVYLTNFYNQKSYLFPILFQSDYIELQDKINILICEMILLIEKNHGKNVKKEDSKAMEDYFIKYNDLKSDLLHGLQVFIIKELE